MRQFCDSAIDGEAWYVVSLMSGSTAVISADDMILLVASGRLQLATKVSFDEGRAFEVTRVAYMSANHRIKAGESGGVD